jgi:NDP-sugar pyrophosphorylase family protein
MPVGDYPILEIVLRQLKNAGIREVILAVGYLGHLFQALFEDGSKYGIEITYSFESEPLGTAGPISLVIDQLKDDFLTMNGDLLTSLNFQALIAYHQRMNAAATISLHKREVHIDYGVVEQDERGHLSNYIEKPRLHYDVSMGINVLKVEAIKPYLTPGKFLDIPDLMMQLKNDGHTIACYQEDCYWLDIGRPEDYRTALDSFESMKSTFLNNWSKE